MSRAAAPIVTERELGSAALIYAFERHELDAQRFELRRDGTRVPVQPKPLALLFHLARHRERLVPRDELVAHLWPDVVVSDDALFHALKVAREAVGDRGRQQRVIETVRGVGFRFVAPVEERVPTRTRVIAPSRARREPRPLVGRDAQLDRVLAALDDAEAQGRGRLFLLEGEAGVGKTRLLDALSEAARARGARVARGVCREAGGPVFSPWSQVLEDLLAGESDATLAALAAGESGAWLSRLVPALRERLPSLPPGEPEDALATESRWRLFGSVAGALVRFADAQPLVVLLDDLHWADVASLRLAEFMVGELRQHPILLVGAHRDERFEPTHPMAALLGEAVRLDIGEAIRLERLSEDGVGELLQSLVGATPARDLARAVHDRTAGNPFFVVQIARELAPRLARAPAAWAEALDGVPAAVRQVVGGRLARLGERTRDVLALAAVAGPEPELALIQRAWDGVDDDVLDAFEEALAARLLEEMPGEGGRLRFVHALIRDAITADLPALRRARLHRAIGEALEAHTARDPDPPAATLAHHFHEAAPVGGTPSAARWAIRAGDAAMRRAAYEEAAGQYERAASWIDVASLDAGSRFDLLLRMGRARHLGSGDYVHARESYLGAAAVAREIGDPARLAEAALSYASIPQSSVLEVEEPCRAVLEEALAAQPPGAAISRARLLARLGAFLANEPTRQSEAISLAEQALATARAAGDLRTMLEALLALQRGLRLEGIASPERRVAISDESVALVGELGDPVLAAIVHGQRVAPLLELGRGADADAAIDRYAEVSQRLRAPVFAWLVPILRATRHLLHGELARVEPTALQALPIAKRVPGSIAPSVLGVVLFALRREQGRLVEIEAPFRALVSQYENIPGPRAWLSLLLAECGRPDEARHAVARLVGEELGTLAGTEGWRSSLAMLGDACVALEDRVHGAAVHAELLPLEHHCVVLGDGVMCLGPAARPLAALDALFGCWDEAETRFERALALCGTLGAPTWDARTRVDWARALRRRGRAQDRARAQRLLETAALVAGRIGMARLLADARALLG